MSSQDNELVTERPPAPVYMRAGILFRRRCEYLIAILKVCKGRHLDPQDLARLEFMWLQWRHQIRVKQVFAEKERRKGTVKLPVQLALPLEGGSSYVRSS